MPSLATTWSRKVCNCYIICWLITYGKVCKWHQAPFPIFWVGPGDEATTKLHLQWCAINRENTGLSNISLTACRISSHKSLLWIKASLIYMPGARLTLEQKMSGLEYQLGAWPSNFYVRGMANHTHAVVRPFWCRNSRFSRFLSCIDGSKVGRSCQ